MQKEELETLKNILGRLVYAMSEIERLEGTAKRLSNIHTLLGDELVGKCQSLYLGVGICCSDISMIIDENEEDKSVL